MKELEQAGKKLLKELQTRLTVAEFDDLAAGLRQIAAKYPEQTKAMEKLITFIAFFNGTKEELLAEMSAFLSEISGGGHFEFALTDNRTNEKVVLDLKHQESFRRSEFDSLPITLPERTLIQ